MIDSAIILAGGLSKRYGKNKLLETFNKKTLMEYNIDFCHQNGIHDIHIVYYDETVKKYLIDKGFVKDKLHRRPDIPEGTGMSLLTGAKHVSGRFIVLFGDNFYYGIVKDDFPGAVATFVERKKDEKNLRLASIKGDKIIEKPHGYDEGRFFAGYLILNKEQVLAQTPALSSRGEIEITEIFNGMRSRLVKPLDIIWEEITYIDDYKKMLDLIESMTKEGKWESS